jgi:hypothetical protein
MFEAMVFPRVCDSFLGEGCRDSGERKGTKGVVVAEELIGWEYKRARGLMAKDTEKRRVVGVRLCCEGLEVRILLSTAV